VIHKFSGTGSLDERWKWARETANRQNFERYWIGYIVRTSGTGDWLYLDRSSPVQAGDSWFTGHMRFNGDFNNMKFSGVSLGSLLGSYSPNDHAIFLGFDATSRRTRLVRVRLANFVFPMHFNRWPLLWLDEVPAGQSVRAIAGLKDDAASKEVLNDLPDVVGAHEDSRAVMPVLVGWLQDTSAPLDFRTESIEALAYHPVPEALAMLMRIARSNEDEAFRAEAVEALGEIPMREAADSLMLLTSFLDSERLRAEAVESLGERPEEHIPAFLERLARTAETRVGMEAIEALAELPENRGAVIVSTLAEDPNLRLDLRREAIESLADLHESPRALETLRKIAFEDPDVGIQIEATEALSDISDPRTVEFLTQIADRHPVAQVQMKAAEALGDVHAHKEALSALDKIARTHPQRAVRIEALEAMGNFSSDGSGAQMLISFLRTRPEESLAIAALEALADAGATRTVVQFLDEFLESDASLGVKIEALETLEDIDGDAATTVLHKYARSENMNLRAKAAEILVDRKN
jgi:HEAT repeat protein